MSGHKHGLVTIEVRQPEPEKSKFFAGLAWNGYLFLFFLIVGLGILLGLFTSPTSAGGQERPHRGEIIIGAPFNYEEGDGLRGRDHAPIEYRGSQPSRPAALRYHPIYNCCGSYMLQVGSFPTRQQAVQDWDRLLDRYPYIFSGAHVRFIAVNLNKRGRWTRLIVGYFNERGAAVAQCRRIRGLGEPCIPQEV